MFEPENDLERALVGASSSRTKQQSFLRQLLDADILIAFSADKIEQKPDGTATIPAGARLAERVVTRNGLTFLAFFSAASRARAIFKDTHLVAPDKTRVVFERHPGAAFVLNPGSEHRREFPPAEAARLLAGDFFAAGRPGHGDRSDLGASQSAIALSDRTDRRPESSLHRLCVDRLGLSCAGRLCRRPRAAPGDRRRTDQSRLARLHRSGAVRRIESSSRRKTRRFLSVSRQPVRRLFEQIEPFYRRAEPEKGWRRWFSRG